MRRGVDGIDEVTTNTLRHFLLLLLPKVYILLKLTPDFLDSVGFGSSIGKQVWVQAASIL